MSNLFFKPWVGENYSTGGMWAKRIMILGESHYQWNHEVALDPQLTIDCIEEQMAGDYKKQFWTNIVIAFLNRHPSLEDKTRFWQSVAFYNYIQSTVGFGPRVRPTPEMWGESERPFSQLLAQLRPNCLIVLGYDLWRHLPWDEPGPAIEGAEQQETRKYQTYDGAQTLAYAIRHPSAGFSGWYWYPFVTRAIEIA